MHLEANTQITPFTFHGHQVRVIADNPDHPLWVARDVATALGYKNPSDAVKRHCKGVAIHDTLPTAGGTQKVRVIAEPDLYRLIVGSELDTAQEFERLVFEEILPSIRKHGAYMTEVTIEQVLTDPDTLIKLATDLKAERARRAELEHQAALDAPKVVFADAVAVSKTAILVGDLAKILRGNGVQVGGTRLFAWMRANGFLINRKGMDWNMPTQRAMELELFKVKETVVTHSDGHTSISKTPKITGKGQRYFIERFLDGRFQIDDAA
ncbi:phage antirepressor [Corynebacterium diphtheriae]